MKNAATPTATLAELHFVELQQRRFGLVAGWAGRQVGGRVVVWYGVGDGWAARGVAGNVPVKGILTLECSQARNAPHCTCALAPDPRREHHVAGTAITLPRPPIRFWARTTVPIPVAHYLFYRRLAK